MKPIQIHFTLRSFFSYIILSLLFTAPLILSGQITLSNQAQVDAFSLTEVTGSLTISGSSIANIDGLAALNSVGGDLIINNSANLLNIDGLSALTSIDGTLTILENVELVSFCGLFPLFDKGSYIGVSISGNSINPTISEIIANGACVSITCPSDSTFFTDIGICCATITLVPPTVQGGSSTTTLVNDYNNSADASDTYFVMTTVVTWTATDAYGNQSSCTQNITVMDNEAPQFGVPDPSCSMYQSCYDTQTIALSNNETTYQQALAACSGDPVCIRAATKAKSAELEGIRKIFLACLDGNTNCSLVPISGALPDLFVSGDGENCEAQVDNPGPVVAENCAAFILTNDNATATNALGSGIYPSGTTTVTWTATDQFGNVSMITRSIIVTTEECIIEYCESEGISTDYEWIKKVKIITINNNSGNNGGYADFTNQTAEVDAGDEYSLKLKPGFAGKSYKEYWRVWLDWNQDGDFEDVDELVVQTTSNGPSTFTRWINVPSDAINGDTRMRVSMKYGSYASSCESFDEGEVEDYTVHVFEGQSFTGNPPNDNKEVVTRSENLNDIAELNVHVYPNPTTGIFSIDISSNKESERNVQVINQLGQAVYTINSAENSIRINLKENNVATGLYTIIIRENNRVITKQLQVIQ